MWAAEKSAAYFRIGAEMNRFEVGEPVICINDKFPEREFTRNIEYPLYKRLYILRWIGMNNGELVVLLKQIRNKPILINGVKKEPTFFAWRFRPLLKPKSKAMESIYALLDTKIKIPEDVDL